MVLWRKLLFSLSLVIFKRLYKAETQKDKILFNFFEYQIQDKRKPIEKLTNHL